MKPYTMHYTQNGHKKSWDILGIHDCVTIVIYNLTRNVLVLVKQFRPSVYLGSLAPEDRTVDAPIDTTKYPPETGITIELCAGMVDKNLPLAEIAREEILEECGYNVPVSSLQFVGKFNN